MASDSQPGTDAAGERRLLLVVAAPPEARAVLTGLGCADATIADREWQRHEITGAVDLVVSGVGKANGAGATARVLDPGRHAGVVSLGIGGSLPRTDGRSVCVIGGVVVSTGSVIADEGLLADDGFVDQAGLGFPVAPGLGAIMPVDGGTLGGLLTTSGRRAGGAGFEAGPVATVSTCSGTDAAAVEVARRTGAIVEAMEGAAVGLVAHRLGVAFGEVRVVSNTTGSRTRQVWDIRGALARLSDVASALWEGLSLRAGEAGEA